MPSQPATPGVRPKRAPMLYVIAAIKMGQGLVLMLAALGAFALAGKDLSDVFNDFLRWLHLDPEWVFFTGIGDWLDTITSARVKAVAWGTMLIGLALLTIGIGLMLRARWAIWVAIGVSAFFIPVEIYELVGRRAADPGTSDMISHSQIALLMLLAVNIVIVWYLYKNRERLFRQQRTR